MKFRTARNTFSRDELVRRLDLKPLNDMPELPLYGTEPRVKVRGLRGPWQEIELRVHSYSEIDRPEFWEFVDQAVGGFGKYAKEAQEKTDILQPWKQLGRKWHFARRGFPLGGKVQWEMEVLEELVELLNETAPYGQLLWNNKQVVPLYVPQQREPWAAVQTKKLDAVYLHLTGPKGRFAQGRITGLGFDAQVNGEKPAWTSYGSSSVRSKTFAAASFRPFSRSTWRRWKRNKILPSASGRWTGVEGVFHDPREESSMKRLARPHTLLAFSFLAQATLAAFFLPVASARPADSRAEYRPPRLRQV